MSKQKTEITHIPSILSFIVDLPNVCSLAGLLCGVLGLYYAVRGNFPFALIGILWAVVFDWADGIIARKIKDRTEYQQAFGGYLDSLIDIVNFGVFPAVFLLSYGTFSPWFLPGSFLVIASSALRLSYFTIFGLNKDRSYRGLALDNNIIILSFLFLFERLIGHNFFSLLLYAVMMIVIIFNLSSLRTPKLSGRWFYVLIAYVLTLTGIYSFFHRFFF